MKSLQYSILLPIQLIPMESVVVELVHLQINLSDKVFPVLPKKSSKFNSASENGNHLRDELKSAIKSMLIRLLKATFHK